jgi:hypothetical protein
MVFFSSFQLDDNDFFLSSSEFFSQTFIRKYHYWLKCAFSIEITQIAFSTVHRTLSGCKLENIVPTYVYTNGVQNSRSRRAFKMNYTMPEINKIRNSIFTYEVGNTYRPVPKKTLAEA